MSFLSAFPSLSRGSFAPLAMLGKITLVTIVIYIILWGMGSYEYLNAPRQAFTVLLVFLAFVWIGKLLLSMKSREKSEGLPPLKWKNI